MGKHLTPTALTVSHVAFIVNIVEASVGHEMMVPATEISLVEAAEELTVFLRTPAAWDVRLNRTAPSSNHFIQGKDPFLVKLCVVSRIPSVGGVCTTVPSTMPHKQLMQTSYRTTFPLNLTMTPIPSEITYKAPVL